MSKGRKNKKENSISAWLGFGLIISGITIFLELQLNSGWLFFLPLIVLGLAFVLSARKENHPLMFILGLNMLSIAFGLFFLLSPAFPFDIKFRMAGLFISLALSWFVTAIYSKVLFGSVQFWSLFLGILLISIGFCFGVSDLRFLDFALFIGVGIGLGLGIWGTFRRYIGLVIPGCLITSTSLGVFFGWNPVIPEPNALARTGVMLVILGIGWALITVLSKRVVNSFLWWPLIPALVISVTGWGLYIGGNPSEAGRFIGNTGSVTLVIFGYVLLLRRGFHKE